MTGVAVTIVIFCCTVLVVAGTAVALVCMGWAIREMFK